MLCSEVIELRSELIDALRPEDTRRLNGPSPLPASVAGELCNGLEGRGVRCLLQCLKSN